MSNTEEHGQYYSYLVRNMLGIYRITKPKKEFDQIMLEVVQHSFGEVVLDEFERDLSSALSTLRLTYPE